MACSASLGVTQVELYKNAVILGMMATAKASAPLFFLPVPASTISHIATIEDPAAIACPKAVAAPRFFPVSSSDSPKV